MARISASEIVRNWGGLATGAGIAAVATSFGILALGEGSVLAGMLGASFLSAVAIGAPLTARVARLERDIRTHRRNTTRAATYDPATLFLNRGAFSGLVERRVEASARGGRRQGAFVIVDAGDVRSVSRKYGLDWGDEALRLIASAIRANVRTDDIVGRIGADQFGVFLAGASERDTAEICERIGNAVRAVYFAPGDSRAELTVTFGGIVFDNELGFDDMFRHASARLEAGAGSSPVSLGHATADSPVH